MAEVPETVSNDISVEEFRGRNSPDDSTGFSTSSTLTASTTDLHNSSSESFSETLELQENGRKLLIDAVKRGDKEQVLELMNAGIDINFKEGAFTPLMLAACFSYPCIVSALLQKGADPNVTNERGTSALHYAVTDHSSKCISLLIDAGANVHCANAEGNTPLHLAARINRKTVQALLRAGSSKTSKNKEGLMPFQLATSADLSDLLRP